MSLQKSQLLASISPGWIYFVLFLAFSPSQAQASEVDSATFYGVIWNGDPVQMTVVGLEKDGEDYTKHCTRNVCKALPKGHYDFTMLVGGRRRVEGHRLLFSRQEWVTVDLGYAADDTDLDVVSNPFRGRIEGLSKSAKDSWARLQLLHGEQRYETPIGPDGRFEFEVAYRGKWTLLIFQDAKLVYEEHLDMKYPFRDVVIRIPK